MIVDIARSIYHETPAWLQHAILVRRRSPIWCRAGIVFIHIPRAAGTSLNHALYGRFMGHAHASDVRRWGSAKLNRLPSFAVTRNPWARLVSAYRFARRGRGVGGVYEAGVQRPAQYAIPQFDTFERFVREWLAPRDAGKLDGIFQPQSPFVCGADGTILVDHVGRIENLTPTVEFLVEHGFAIPALESSNASGAAVDYRTFYTDDLIEMVGAIYAQDVRRFGYEF